MQEAKRMLQDRERPLKEISISIGYKDPNYFSRVFKKQVGCSPKQYQQGKR
jgi:two-component system response regulator YesN